MRSGGGAWWWWCVLVVVAVRVCGGAWLWRCLLVPRGPGGPARQCAPAWTGAVGEAWSYFGTLSSLKCSRNGS